MDSYLNEKTPLLSESTPVVYSVPRRRRRSKHQRYPYRTTRGLCSVLFSGLSFVAVCFLVILVVHPDILRSNGEHHGYLPWGTLQRPTAWPQSNGILFEDLEKLLLSTPDESRIRDYSKYYTAGPYLAGRNLSQAIWTRNRWQEVGIRDSSIVAYDVYLNYPKSHRLALLQSNWNTSSGTIKFEAVLEEDVLAEDSTSSLPDRIPTFHGYSASGNVTAQYVWANYGTFKDYEELLHANVSLKGKIALVRYGGIFRGLKVKRAQELGMVGVVIYSDPGDDGEITEKNGYTLYPEGPARQPSSVQRGSVQFLSFAPGDPTTPGYPSKPGVPRTNTDHAIPSIPSLPISYLDALPLLRALNGHGLNVSHFGRSWQTGGLGYKGVKYNIGPSPPSLKLNLVNEQEYVTTPLWNVIGIINGTILDEVVVIGNHRDAWIAGGAGDPNSGSAVLNEVARGLGEALKAGWKPLRTIVLASWDGEELGLVGSTEWVEEYLPWLSHSAVAYLNVDVAAAGPNFDAAAAPLLNKILIESTYKVMSPNQTIEGQTVGNVWNKHISTIGSGSDFTAFQDFAGIPCISIGFGGGRDSPIYHYHSNYDSFHWMEKFGDPGFHYHATMAKLWGLLTVQIVERPILQFNATDYAAALAKYVYMQKEHAKVSPIGSEISFAKLDAAISTLHNATVALDATAATLQQQLEDPANLAWYRWWKRSELFHKVRDVNKKYKYLERQFLYSKGLDKRSWFKHTVFAPGRWTGYAGATFPGLTESLEDGDIGNFYNWEGIISGKIFRAVESLR